MTTNRLTAAAWTVLFLLAIPDSASANHLPPDTISAHVGDLQCNTAAGTKAGQVPLATTTLTVSDNGQMRMAATGSAIGLLGCTFSIVVNSYSFVGFGAPAGTISNVVNTPCVVAIPPGSCDATHEFTWSVLLVDPLGRLVTWGIEIDYDLVVDTTVVASGVWSIDVVL